MPTAEQGLLDLPSPATRADKAVWRQATSLLATALGDALATYDIESPQVAVSCASQSYVRFLRHVLPSVTELAPGGPNPEVRSHVLAVCLDGSETSPERIAALKRGFDNLRPAGRLVVLANVVAAPGVSVTPPSMTRLIGELQWATGSGLQLEELRSIRWANEPFHRGVLMTMQSLSIAGP